MSDLLLVNMNVLDALKRKYKIETLGNWRWSKKTGVEAMPIPMGEGDTTILMKLAGGVINSTLTFKIENDGTARAQTKATGSWVDISESKTVWEQIGILISYFCSGDMENKVTFFAGTDGFGGDTDTPTSDYTLTGQIQSMDLSFDGGLEFADCTISIVFGTAI